MGWGLHALRVPRAGAGTGAGQPQALQFVHAGGRGVTLSGTCAPPGRAEVSPGVGRSPAWLRVVSGG